MFMSLIRRQKLLTEPQIQKPGLDLCLLDMKKSLVRYKL